MAKKHTGSNLAELQNATKTLLANIKFRSPDKPVRALAITSSVASEGKSTTTIELAKAMVSSGARVLLVENDMRRPSLAAMLQTHSSAGMFAVMAGEAVLEAAVAPTSVPNLYLLDVESRIPNPADIISSNRYRSLVEQLRERFDYVVFDTPPVGAFVDAAILSTLVDGVIMVVKQGSTKRREIEHAYDQLKKANANVLGICSTFCQEGDSDYYYYSYYYYSQPKPEPKGFGKGKSKSKRKEKKGSGKSKDGSGSGSGDLASVGLAGGTPASMAGGLVLGSGGAGGAGGAGIAGSAGIAGGASGAAGTGGAGRSYAGSGYVNAAAPSPRPSYPSYPAGSVAGYETTSPSGMPLIPEPDAVEEFWQGQGQGSSAPAFSMPANRLGRVPAPERTHPLRGKRGR